MCTKLTGHNTESVGQAVGVRSDKRCKQSTFGVDTTACTAVVPTRYPATRGYGCHWTTEAGVPYPIAGKYVVWEEGKPRTIESRQAEVSRSVMVVEPMTQQGQWSCFGPDRAFAYQIDTGRVIPFESTSNGWNLTVELEAPDDANSKVPRSHGHHDRGTDRESPTHEETASCNQTDVDWTREDTFILGGKPQTCKAKRAIIETVDRQTETRP